MTSLELLNLTEDQKLTGIFISGDVSNGEYKRWREDGSIAVHYKYNNGQKEIITEDIYKYNNGQKEIITEDIWESIASLGQHIFNNANRGYVSNIFASKKVLDEVRDLILK